MNHNIKKRAIFNSKGLDNLTVELIKEDRRKLLVIMEDIVRKCELEALAVVTQSNAEEVAFFTDIDTNVDIFCALAAASLDTATKVTNKMKHGSVLELVVLGETGYTIMSPVSDKYILIGAGKDFYSLGKTILILREKVQDIPLTLSDKRPTTTKRKACSHFCQFDDLYCCVCSSKKENLCDICQTSIQQKQAEQKKLLEEALEKAKMNLEEEQKKEGNTTFAFTPEKESHKDSNNESQMLFNKVLTKIQTLESTNQLDEIKKSPKKASRKRNTKPIRTSKSKTSTTNKTTSKKRQKKNGRNIRRSRK